MPTLSESLLHSAAQDDEEAIAAAARGDDEMAARIQRRAANYRRLAQANRDMARDTGDGAYDPLQVAPSDHAITPMQIGGAEIAAWRTALGLSREDLSRALSVSLMTVGRWERGEVAPPHPGMLRLALEALAVRLGR